MAINYKKKENMIMLISICAVIMIVSALSISIKATSIPKKQNFSTYLGDVDLDGKVTSADSRLISRMSVGLDSNKALADINQDGKITSEDARLALRTSTGLETKTSVNTYIDLNGNTAILYKQNDSTNKNITYAGRYKNTIGKSAGYITRWDSKSKDIFGSVSSSPKLGANGCGPTSCAIVATTFGKPVTPKNLVNNNTKCYSNTEDIIKYFNGIGLKAEKINYGANNYKNAINNGKKLIVLVGTSNYSTVIGKIGNVSMGKGTFHWYTILDYNSSTDKFYVADPYLYNGVANCGWMKLSTLTGVYTTIAVGR